MYDRLRPSEADMASRKQLVEKLQRIFDSEWPAHRFIVHPFGSAVNMLCSRASDIDRCQFAIGKRHGRSCHIAHLLRKHGFRDIDLRKARARVPVVRFVDPDLHLSCDINVNNPLALHNTLFVRHYVTRHPLVAPFMLLIKYWTQRRVLNDA
ncbi:hypothetical protein BCR44DRAFT_115197, partial [Catenaria anguillulae PL171]